MQSGRTSFRLTGQPTRDIDPGIELFLPRKRGLAIVFRPQKLAGARQRYQQWRGYDWREERFKVLSTSHHSTHLPPFSLGCSTRLNRMPVKTWFEKCHICWKKRSSLSLGVEKFLHLSKKPFIRRKEHFESSPGTFAVSSTTLGFI